MAKRFDRLGETRVSNEGYEMVIVKSEGDRNIYVEFQDDYKFIKKTSYKHFREGAVSNPYHNSVYGVGVKGVGNYNDFTSNDIRYRTWSGMLRRCYSEEYLSKKPSYKGCVVCEEWKNYQNFAKWFDDNYYEIEGETMCLDKDILVKNNKIYSPKTCIFVPNCINSLFTKSNRIRGEYPIGVNSKNGNIFYAVCSDGTKHNIRLGSFKTIEEAFITYKNFKECTIKSVADKYKDFIPSKLYEALYLYKVEITD